MRLTDIIQRKYPKADFHPITGNVMLQDNSDGKGPFIAAWDTVALGAPPTDEEFAAMLKEKDA